MPPSRRRPPTVAVALEHFHLLFIVGPAEQLTLLDDVLIALLQPHATDDADEALQMEHIIQGAHYQLVGTNLLTTSEASVPAVQSAGELRGKVRVSELRWGRVTAAQM